MFAKLQMLNPLCMRLNVIAQYRNGWNLPEKVVQCFTAVVV